MPELTMSKRYVMRRVAQMRAGAAGFTMASLMLVLGSPAVGQEIILPIQSLDREVILRWTKAPGDTFTALQRSEVEQVSFFAFRTQGYLPNSFPNGARVTGRGVLVPSEETSTSTLEVGNAGDLFLAATPPPPPPPGPTFDVAGVFQFGRNLIGVAYTQPVDEASALTTSNYSFSPSIGLTGARLQENGQTVILETGGTLTPGDYTLTVTGVTNEGGASLGSSGPFPFTAPAVSSPLNIAEIYADPSAFQGDVVTVFGQVTIPTGSRDITEGNGFIQDGSGRGIRLRGNPIVSAVNSRANAVQVTGTVGSEIGLEIINYSAALLAGGLPFLGAKELPLLQVDDSGLNGTYYETIGHMGRVDAVADPDEVHYYAVTLDTLFAGYQVWRAPAEDPTNFVLLRTYNLLDSTWTFTGDERIFNDPDSVIARGALPPGETEGEVVEVPGPFNGFTYLYSVTAFDALVDATVFPFRITQFDSLRGEEGVLSPPVRPSQTARVSSPLLAEVRVVPNPYNPAADFGKQVFPGAPRVQFVNLPSKALIKIFTTSGDQVRELEKPENTGVDAVDWDLKNANGRDVASGIYVFTVEAEGERFTGHFVLAR